MRPIQCMVTSIYETGNGLSENFTHKCVQFSLNPLPVYDFVNLQSSLDRILDWSSEHQLQESAPGASIHPTTMKHIPSSPPLLSFLSSSFSLSSHTFPLRFPHLPSLSFPSLSPNNGYGHMGEQVRAEPGRQTHFGAIHSPKFASLLKHIASLRSLPFQSLIMDDWPLH